MIVSAYELSLMQAFPYYVEQGIAHDNIWSTTPLTTHELVEVSAVLHNCFPIASSVCSCIHQTKIII